jgi:N-acyl-phosphatidylethanolamine-hydrolysing phospholipase D
MVWGTPKKRRGRFVNPHCADLKRTLWHVLLWFCGFYRDAARLRRPPADFRFPNEAVNPDASKPSVSWIGHSTFLVQAGGCSFLTDPVFGSYCSPVPLRKLKRRHSPAVKVDALPPIDVILLSHNHYDHLDEKSTRALHRFNPKAVWVVPRGVKRWFVRRGIENVRELNWGESVEVKGCKITAVPAQHYSGRGLFDKNRTLWCGYVVDCGEKTFYFVGDTGYNSVQFKQIGEAFPKIDLSLIPIGTYVPKKFMQPVHISPEEAVEIHCDVGSRLSVGMHWNTFILSEEVPEMPPYDLFLALERKKLPPSSFLPLRLGQQINW